MDLSETACCLPPRLRSELNDLVEYGEYGIAARIPASLDAPWNT